MKKVTLTIPSSDKQWLEAELFQVEDEMLKEVGIRIPVLIDKEVWSRYVEVPEGLKEQRGINGRLWDMLFMFNINAQLAKSEVFQFSFLCRLPEGWDFYSNEKSCHGTTVQRGVTLTASLMKYDNDSESPVVLIKLPDKE